RSVGFMGSFEINTSALLNEACLLMRFAEVPFSQVQLLRRQYGLYILRVIKDQVSEQPFAALNILEDGIQQRRVVLATFRGGCRLPTNSGQDRNGDGRLEGENVEELVPSPMDISHGKPSSTEALIRSLRARVWIVEDQVVPTGPTRQRPPRAVPFEVL